MQCNTKETESHIWRERKNHTTPLEHFVGNLLFLCQWEEDCSKKFYNWGLLFSNKESIFVHNFCGLSLILIGHGIVPSCQSQKSFIMKSRPMDPGHNLMFIGHFLSKHYYFWSIVREYLQMFSLALLLPLCLKGMPRRNMQLFRIQHKKASFYSLKQ